MTDAGTPAVSDPGADLVAAWAGEGGSVVPIPGASAVLAAVAASGVAGPRWAFEGFLPRSGRERRDRLAAIAARSARDRAVRGARAGRRRRCATWRRPAATSAPGAVARELTKLHEQIVRGSLGELAGAAADGSDPGPWRVRAGRRDGRGGGCRQPFGRRRSGPRRGARSRRAARRRRASREATPPAGWQRETGLPRRRLYGRPDV